jgi:predicted small lipoprotein YifL
MTKIKLLKRLVLIAASLAILTACGQKGDLYLPDTKQLTALD